MPCLRISSRRGCSAGWSATWEGGKHNLIADALPRALVSAAALLDAGEHQEEAVFVQALVEGDVEVAGWLYLDAKEDDDYQKLVGAHLNGDVGAESPTGPPGALLQGGEGPAQHKGQPKRAPHPHP